MTREEAVEMAESLSALGMVRIGVVAPELRVADVAFNEERICRAIEAGAARGCRFLLFPELCVTGYTCGDLFFQPLLIERARQALGRIARATAGSRATAVVGAPVIDLLASPPPGPVNLLKLPHHGSRRSSTHLLLERFRPQLAFVSVGAGNRFGFPHTEVLADLREHGIPLYRTDRSGSLRFFSDGRGWHARQWQQGLFR